MDGDAIGTAQRRIVDHLKRASPSTTADLALALGISGAAVRPQLAELEDRGLVEQQQLPASGRGRPPSAWSLTPLAIDLFPDRHRDLTVELLDDDGVVSGSHRIPNPYGPAQGPLCAKCHTPTPE